MYNFICFQVSVTGRPGDLAVVEAVMEDLHGVGVGMIVSLVMEHTTPNLTVSMPCSLRRINRWLHLPAVVDLEVDIAAISTSKPSIVISCLSWSYMPQTIFRIGNVQNCTRHSGHSEFLCWAQCIWVISCARDVIVMPPMCNTGLSWSAVYMGGIIGSM